jgi:hypothetical protein
MSAGATKLTIVKNFGGHKIKKLALSLNNRFTSKKFNRYFPTAHLKINIFVEILLKFSDI